MAGIKSFVQSPQKDRFTRPNRKIVYHKTGGSRKSRPLGRDANRAPEGEKYLWGIRGRGAATALLDAALRDAASAGALRCAVDFESFNPEASALWMKYFTPVCLSVMRVPEKG